MKNILVKKYLMKNSYNLKVLFDKKMTCTKQNLSKFLYTTKIRTTKISIIIVENKYLLKTYI